MNEQIIHRSAYVLPQAFTQVFTSPRATAHQQRALQIQFDDRLKAYEMQQPNPSLVEAYRLLRR